PRARVVCAPAEAGAVLEATGIEPETPRSMRAWVETLASAETVVTVDTGAAHVAGMLCERVVDVFPDAHFDVQVRRWRPWAASYRAVRASEIDGAPDAVAEAVLDGF
ncbi:MAG TPA: glycosyltransferase family 9 protein, partial [Candidatus Elarobacter sp.]|nr:glycosyltransferase family 9 protein [Candidatus Elarobacter sp.]